ncbi:MAG: hypothetical protein EB084_11680 [Proteobacteria bacterium]|nr:hypothetical protein [Pseudomonadota bacterium]
MGRSFTQYWSSTVCRAAARDEGSPLIYLSGDAFARHEVSAGDRIYAITVRDGRVLLIARMEVGIVADTDQAQGLLESVDDASSSHLLAEECTALRFDRKVSKAVLKRLRFIAAQGGRPIDPSAGRGEIDVALLRGVRLLDDASAQRFDEMFVGETTYRPEFTEDEEDDDEALDGLALLEALAAWFDAEGVPYEVDDDGDLNLEVEVDDETFPVLILGNDPYVSYFVALPLRVPRRRYGVMMEALLRANFKSAAVYFDFDFDEGIVQCRSRTMNPGAILEGEDLGDLFEITVELSRRFLPAFKQVIDDEATPEEAVDAVLAQLAIDAAGGAENVRSHDEADSDGVLEMGAVDLARLFRTLQIETEGADEDEPDGD